MVNIAPPEVKAPTPKKSGQEGPKSPSSFIERPLHEFVQVKEDVPEIKNKPVRIDQNLQTLIDAAVRHYSHIDKILNPSGGTAGPTIDMQKKFYEMFKAKFRDKNLKDKDILATCAQQFVSESGQNINLVVELATWEVMHLQGSTLREIKIKGKPVESKENLKRKKIEMTSEGFTYEDEDIGTLRSLGRRKKVITKLKYEMAGGSSMNLDPTTNHLVTNAGKTFLEACGWASSATLDDKQLEKLDSLILSITSLRTEKYVKTGFDDLAKVYQELNFIKDAPTGATLVYNGKTFRDTRTAHFAFERGTGSNVRELIEADGVEIITDIKKQATDKLKQAQEEANKKSIEEDTVAHLEAEIQRLKSKAEKSQAWKDLQKTVLEYKIKILKDKLVIFNKKQELPAKIAEAKEAEKAAKEELDVLQATIYIPNEEAVNLLEWGGIEGVKEQSVEYIRSQLAQAQQLDTRQSQVDELRADEKEYLKAITGADTVDPQVSEILKNIRAEIKKLSDERKTDKIADATLNPSDLTTDQLVASLKNRLKRREDAVNANREAINKYKTAKGNREKLEAEKGRVDTEVSTIGTSGFKVGDYDFSSLKTAEQIDEEEKKLEKEKEKPKAIEETTQTEIDCLEALKLCFGHENINKRKERNSMSEAGELAFNYISGTGLEKYPKVVIRFVQRVLGPEFTLAANATNKEKIERMMTFLSSQKYLNIIVDKLSATGCHLEPVGTSPPVKVKDGKYIDLDDVFPIGAAIKGIDYKTLADDTIEKIIEEMRIQALNIIQ